MEKECPQCGQYLQFDDEAQLPSIAQIARKHGRSTVTPSSSTDSGATAQNLSQFPQIFSPKPLPSPSLYFIT